MSSKFVPTNSYQNSYALKQMRSLIMKTGVEALQKVLATTADFKTEVEKIYNDTNDETRKVNENEATTVVTNTVDLIGLIERYNALVPANKQIKLDQTADDIKNMLKH